jgi:hypothetical protein
MVLLVDLVAVETVEFHKVLADKMELQILEAAVVVEVIPILGE